MISRVEGSHDRIEALAIVGLIANAQTRYLMTDVVRKLRWEYGTIIHLYCPGPESVDFYERENIDGVIASFTDCVILYPAARQTKFDSTRACADGVVFLHGTKDTSFDLRDYDYVDLWSYDEEAVEGACRALIKSLEGQPSRAAVPKARSA